MNTQFFKYPGLNSNQISHFDNDHFFSLLILHYIQLKLFKTKKNHFHNLYEKFKLYLN